MAKKIKHSGFMVKGAHSPEKPTKKSRSRKRIAGKSRAGK